MQSEAYATGLQMGWTCANGDNLQDAVKVIRWRVAKTRFIWIKGHAVNDRGDRVDCLAKEGASKPALHMNYNMLQESPWSHIAFSWADSVRFW
jgi:ribonuclease HI